MRRERRSIRDVRKSTWAIFGTIAFVVLVTYTLRRWLSPGDWAGVGQWFGGLGALIAAWVALRVASDERRRESRRDAERLRVQAFYIVGGLAGSEGSNGVQVFVRITRHEPVVNIDVVALHVVGRSETFVVECAPTGERRQVLQADERRSHVGRDEPARADNGIPTCSPPVTHLLPGASTMSVCTSAAAT
ncbi:MULTISPECIES: hypothetical protein [unclassified Amycolatopsis]|uniref:hypothetical protein n=1 Tax=unclassified Amycolatopsis TaxID=2618356 RepID=UPI0028766B9C|nr:MULTISPECIES: hypothetical protein [unclassified Amycolatopsis]MDS0134659.1 hypothetical protein [Amycolatopsis sp. 505]MDS0147442.1 hypothetical protein [Amycolatopsis sp. CM201R]